MTASTIFRIYSIEIIWIQKDAIFSSLGLEWFARLTVCNNGVDFSRDKSKKITGPVQDARVGTHWNSRNPVKIGFAETTRLWKTRSAIDLHCNGKIWKCAHFGLRSNYQTIFEEISNRKMWFGRTKGTPICILIRKYTGETTGTLRTKRMKWFHLHGAVGQSWTEIWRNSRIEIHISRIPC